LELVLSRSTSKFQGGLACNCGGFRAWAFPLVVAQSADGGQFCLPIQPLGA